MNIFNSNNKSELNSHDFDDKLTSLSTAFGLTVEDAKKEWACFLPYLVRMHQCQSVVREVQPAHTSATTSSSEQSE